LFQLKLLFLKCLIFFLFILIIYLIQNEITQLQRRILALESEIEDKYLEERDQRDNHEKYQKLYIETSDPGFLNYLNDYRTKIKFINKKLISLENEKLALEKYLERLK
jgi:hypothetical protein